MTATRIDASSASRPAQCDFILSPPSRMNSVASGTMAKSVLTNSESPTGSRTCLYISPPPGLEAGYPRTRAPEPSAGPGARRWRDLHERVDRLDLAPVELVAQTRDPRL